MIFKHCQCRKREWSVGGKFAAPPGTIEMSPYSKPLAGLLGDAAEDGAIADLQKNIQSMVDERLAAKLSRDFETADAIRDELMDTYTVLVNDDMRMWSIGGVFNPPPEPYKMSPYSPPLPEGIDAGRVAALVEERDAARLDRDFRTADDIKVGLQEDYDIVINDKLKQWSVGGNFGPQQEEKTTTSTSRGCVYARSGGGSVTPEDQAAIEQLLNERAVHQGNKDFGKADRVRERLENDFKVRVDDRNREWHVVTNDFTYRVTAHSLDEDTIAYIEEQVSQREVARLQKEYEVADNIRDALMDQFAVSIDDRLKGTSVTGIFLLRFGITNPGDVRIILYYWTPYLSSAIIRMDYHRRSRGQSCINKYGKSFGAGI
jgi:cysteinyl-tRNA synthetase